MINFWLQDEVRQAHMKVMDLQVRFLKLEKFNVWKCVTVESVTYSRRPSGFKVLELLKN